jgi:uncharacterized protein
MTKFLITLLVLVVGWTLWKKSRAAAGQRADEPRRDEPARGRRRAARVEAMVACVRCGVHVPESESVLRDGRRFCSETHAREGGP